jgi:hypothetical protein
MKLPKHRNDRVMVGMGSVLVGLAITVGLTSALSDPQFAELCSVPRLLGNSASAMRSLSTGQCCWRTRRTKL